ncbi:hypothetical protein KEM48_004627 [Puccinia striiformis f. sp. tritici PST-130]|nr:hypothetical protein KEM48_004627 [Puccinia striiformis f. sp. tritici PST-130]
MLKNRPSNPDESRRRSEKSSCVPIYSLFVSTQVGHIETCISFICYYRQDTTPLEPCVDSDNCTFKEPTTDGRPATLHFKSGHVFTGRSFGAPVSTLAKQSSLLQHQLSGVND